jgi:hypothetical protein
MLVEYIVFGALVLAALLATFVGVRRRRAETVLDPSINLPFLSEGTSSTSDGATHPHHSGGFHDGGGSHAGGSFDGSGGSHGGGSHGGGGHGH